MTLPKRRRRGAINPTAEVCFSVEEFYAARLAAIAHETGTTAQRLGAKILREWLLMRPMRPASAEDLAVSAASVPVSPAVFDAARSAGVTAMQDGLLSAGFRHQAPNARLFNELARDISDAAVGTALVAIARGEQ